MLTDISFMRGSDIDINLGTTHASSRFTLFLIDTGITDYSPL